MPVAGDPLSTQKSPRNRVAPAQPPRPARGCPARGGAACDDGSMSDRGPSGQDPDPTEFFPPLPPDTPPAGSSEPPADRLRARSGSHPGHAAGRGPSTTRRAPCRRRAARTTPDRRTAADRADRVDRVAPADPATSPSSTRSPCPGIASPAPLAALIAGIAAVVLGLIALLVWTADDDETSDDTLPAVSTSTTEAPSTTETDDATVDDPRRPCPTTTTSTDHHDDHHDHDDAAPDDHDPAPDDHDRASAAGDHDHRARDGAPAAGCHPVGHHRRDPVAVAVPRRHRGLRHHGPVRRHRRDHRPGAGELGVRGVRPDRSTSTTT